MNCRVLITIAAASLLAAAGCTPSQTAEEQIWEQIKLADLTEPNDGQAARAEFLATMRVSIRAIDLPADKLGELDPVWDTLSAKPIRVNNYTAFAQNHFRVRFGRIETWQQMREMIAEAGGQEAATTSLVLTDNETSDLPIAELPTRQVVTFVGPRLSRQKVELGPGLLVLRLRPEPIPWSRGVRKTIAYPTFTLPIQSAIGPLQMKARQREFYFAPAAFAAQMGPGDLLMLGPDEYTGERVSLGGLFFSHPEGTMFFRPEGGGPPARKAFVRIYVVICTGITRD
jgi:hypothetical protein